ncbi:BON domain protein [Rubripirellula amarantea]|uniref:BON domain protein n=1 Tax=Rubripirellula amarantea TaxID=2527999 RepID=A0A5C5WH75_9BACT|nr:BON domain-containing protein [Rubripirellula amarantea]TWT49353.1 BON domain protein [Rubripirellula amarantea]
MLSHRKCVRSILVAASVMVFVCSNTTVHAQNGGTDNGGTNSGGTNTGGQTTGGNTGATSGNLRSADDAFSNVQRGDTVGSTAGTGASFSDLGVGATGNAGGGGGGFGGLGGGGGFGGFGGLGGIFGGQGLGSSQSTQPAIRTRLRSAIEVSPTTSVQSQRQVSQHLYQVPARAGMQNVNVVIEGQTAIVTGTVSSERDRRMSELLMRLEPGVRHVDNRTRVVAPAPGFSGR